LTRKSDAKQFLAGVRADLMRGGWVDPSRSRITLAGHVDEYLARAQSRNRPTTVARDRRVLGKHLLPQLGDRPCAL
jgi:hypothetical protein